MGKIGSAWAHCKQLAGGKGKTFLMCLYCDKIIKGGGINRLKVHLDREKRQVEQCNKVSTNA